MLLDAAVAAGAIRSDVEAADLLRAMSGICMASDQPGWQDQARRLVDLLLDGLRYGAPAPAGHQASRRRTLRSAPACSAEALASTGAASFKVSA